MMHSMTNRQICLEDSQPVEDLRFQNVDRKYVKLKKVYIVMAYVALMLLALIILASESSYAFTLWITVECALAVACLINISLTGKIYAFAGYALRDQDISYRSGIFFPTVTTVPFSRVQQVSVRMNPISRIFKLCCVDVTNGSQGASNQFSIPGLTKDTADKIKSLLISKTECGND